MSNIGAMVGELIAAGCAPEVAAKVVASAFIAGVASAEIRGQSADESADRRREKDRIRQQIRRDNLRNPQTSADNPQMSQSASLSKDIDSKESKRRGVRIPADFPTAEDHGFAKQLGWSDKQIEDEAANFRDYWLGCPGAKGVKLDWPATWRKWARSSRVKPVASLTIVRPSDVDWRPIMDSYRRFKHWPKGHGNEPGMPGCRVPLELLKECGSP